MTQRILALVPKGSDACLQWRVWWPSQALQRQGIVYDWMYFKDYQDTVEPALCSGKYNIIVTPRFTLQERWMVKRFQVLMQQVGLKWLYESDDDWFSPEIIRRHVTYKMAEYRLGGYTTAQESAEDYEAGVRWEAEFLQRERTRILGLVDGVTVSTEPLAKVVQRYTQSPVVTVPNFIDIADFQQNAARIERTVPPLTIGWSGGWRYDEDLENMAKAWSRIARTFPEVRFVLLGGWQVPSIVNTLPAGRLRILPWSPIEDYPAALKNIDIACCSVSDAAWNNNKTSIKWLEASLAGSVCVASHALYGRDITDGYDGLLATTVEEWEQQLSRLIIDQKLRQQLQLNALQTIRQHYALANNWHRWLEAFTLLQHSKEQLV